MFVKIDWRFIHLIVNLLEKKFMRRGVLSSAKSKRDYAHIHTHTHTHMLALASKINTQRMKQRKKMMCVDTELQTHEYHTIDSHRECLLSRNAPSSAIASKIERSENV